MDARPLISRWITLRNVIPFHGEHGHGMAHTSASAETSMVLRVCRFFSASWELHNNARCLHMRRACILYAPRCIRTAYNYPLMISSAVNDSTCTVQQGQREIPTRFDGKFGCDPRVSIPSVLAKDSGDKNRSNNVVK